MTSYSLPRLVRRQIRVEREAHAHRTILRLYGVLDATSVLSLQPTLETRLGPSREILVDLSRLEAIEASGVMTLAWLVRRARASGAEVRMVGVRNHRPAIVDFLDAAGLIHDD